MQFVNRLCYNGPASAEVERSLISGTASNESLDKCFYSSHVLSMLVTVLAPALLLFLWQAIVLPRAFYSIALFEKAYTSLSGTSPITFVLCRTCTGVL